MLAVAIAIVIVGALLGVIGARRTQSISQIVAAVIGAAFAIGLQFTAIVSLGTTADPRAKTRALLIGVAIAFALSPSALISGDAKPRRASRHSPRRYPRTDGPAPAFWRSTEHGSP
jgi:hypothetical protein